MPVHGSEIQTVDVTVREELRIGAGWVKNTLLRCSLKTEGEPPPSDVRSPHSSDPLVEWASPDRVRDPLQGAAALAAVINQ
jgi:hypothetical protein